MRGRLRSISWAARAQGAMRWHAGLGGLVELTQALLSCRLALAHPKMDDVPDHWAAK